MEEDLNYNESGEELVQPTEESFGPKPREILELEESLDIKINETQYALFHSKNYSNQVSFSRNRNGEITSLRLDAVKPIDFSILQKFTLLRQLSLKHSIVRNIDWISQLKFLKELSLHNSHVKDLSPIGLLKHLTGLQLMNESIEDTTFLERLENLKYLLCQRIQISDLEFVRKMPNLQQLTLGANNLIDINPVGSLTKLVSFCAWTNEIYDVRPLSDVKSLEEIYLQENLIVDISPLTLLPKLRKCVAIDNRIMQVPPEFVYRGMNISSGGPVQDVDGLYISGNPLTSPPWSVFELGMPTVHAYFENKEKYGAKPLNEGRIIFVGDGSAGKTSLMNRIIYNRFDKKENQTNGIKIEQWHLQKDERDLKFNMWDFGGQEVQHAVHKFFFTSGCLYILVLDSRKEEEPEYWLQQIETLGGKAPVMVVFNKNDQNPTENVDRKFLKEKYPNIVGFYNLSCLTGAGLSAFQKVLEEEAPELSTVNDQFPGNWFEIKKELEASTSDAHHYLVYDAYVEICKKNGVSDEATQRLLLQYFSYIGTVTWFGDNNTYLEHMHVLNPAWITQGVYRIVTGNKTEVLKGQINISDFKELLQPILKGDYVYNESHHGYILALMKKFELCYTDDDKDILIPSRFSKEPKIEYKDFIGGGVRTYLFQFNDYLPVAVIHQFIVRNIERAFDRNYWYQGIVIQNKDKDTQAMVQLDKEAKRIFVRVKGEHVIGLWEYIREDIYSICSRYANLPYSEQIQLLENGKEGLVQYEDLVGHIKARRDLYFHPKLQREYYVGYLMGLFETKDYTLEKVKEGKLVLEGQTPLHQKTALPIVIQILNNNSPTVNTQVNTQVKVEINIQLVQQLTTDIKEDANYLLEEIKDRNKALSDALQLALRFADEMSKVKNKEEAQGKGWARRLKQVIAPIKYGLEFLRLIPEGYDAAQKILQHIGELAHQLAISVPGL